MDCRVVVEAAVPVYDVETADEAVRIAIAKTGEMLNPDLSYVDIEMGRRTSPGGEALQPALVVADEALVALELEMTVFNVEGAEHARRIARTEIGKRLEGVPLKVLDTERLPADGQERDEAGGQTGSDDEQVGEKRGDHQADERNDGRDDDENKGDHQGDDRDDEQDPDDGSNETSNREDDGLLPEFEEMVDENRS